MTTSHENDYLVDKTPAIQQFWAELERCAFKDVDAQFAWDEGEDDRSLESWRSNHWSYFGRECAVLGLTPSEDMPVVLERFELLHPRR